MTREELEKVRAWADAKIATGAEPPWAWYQYMKLRETLDALLAGADASLARTAGSPQQGEPQGTGPRLAVSNVRPGTAQRHREEIPVQLPT